MQLVHNNYDNPLVNTAEATVLAVLAALDIEVTHQTFGDGYWMTVHTADGALSFDLANPIDNFRS